MNPRKQAPVILGLAIAAAVVVGGAGASGGTADYGSAALVQAGHGPGGPPTTSLTRAPQASRSLGGHDYASPRIIQLGYGPGGPRAPSSS